ncbi:MAG: hypothetical protein CMI05_13040 [Oceanospirillaceae bacterium]|nr:hypothetical protein [Oceanospirillaceae bacterium]|tara:strand:+ start:31569 stop:31892 length:324 start_codon:yes stop_codon:yes gene_type:complete
MNLTCGSKIAITLGAISLALFVFILYFRACIYADMYIAPEDPYGISDIIEFILGCLLLALFAISAAFSVFIFFKGLPQSRKTALILIVFSASLLLLYSPLHSVAARW